MLPHGMINFSISGLVEKNIFSLIIFGYSKQQSAGLYLLAMGLIFSMFYLCSLEVKTTTWLLSGNLIDQLID